MVLDVVSGDARPYSFDCEVSDGGGGGLIETALPNEAASGSARPTRKRLNHRGPLSVDVSSAWYFITICAEERCVRAVASKPPYRANPAAVSSKPPYQCGSTYFIAGAIIDDLDPCVIEYPCFAANGLPRGKGWRRRGK